MPTVTKKHFTLFSRSVRGYLKSYGLGGWTVEIHHEGEGEDGMARVLITPEGRRADVYLARSWSEEVTPERLANKARHEVFHILLGRFAALAAKRFVALDELYEAEEELVAQLLSITETPAVKTPSSRARRSSSPAEKRAVIEGSSSNGKVALVAPVGQPGQNETQEKTQNE